MALFGQLGEFVEGQEEWQQYAERMGHFLTANGVTTEDRKCSIFLSVIGPKTYKLLCSLVSPNKPGDKSFAELVQSLKSHYNPEPSEIVERYKFHTRFRKTGESVATFVSELRTLAQTCNFGDSLGDMLRDRLVCGINDNYIQRRLLSEPRLDFKKAMELALGLETAVKNARELQSSGREFASMEGVNKLDPGDSEAAKPCYRCGKTSHLPWKCPFREAKCFNCGKKGHVRSVCRSRSVATGKGRQRQAVQQLETKMAEVQAEKYEEYELCQLQGEKIRPLEVPLQIEGQPLVMELDTGAAVSLVSEFTYRRLCPNKPLQETTTHLRTYSGEQLVILGQLEVEVQYGAQRARLPLCVVHGTGSSLLGRDWLQHLCLDWPSICQVQSVEQTAVNSVLDRHKNVFREELGTLQGFEAKIYVDPTAKPVFCKARSVPYAMKVKVEEELERLVKQGILEPVEFAEWAAPIVPVVKSDKSSVRICGDFKLTVNKASKLDQYPIPRIEDLFATLNGGKTFTKLDMRQAYQQLPLDEESKAYLVINTHRGLYRYNRLPFGVSSAPGIFQRVMESLLNGIPGVIVYIDDILVTGTTTEEHLKALDEVLSRLEKAGLCLQKQKYSFMQTSVTYLGHSIEADGIRPVPERKWKQFGRPPSHRMLSS